jgi:hypothetical protein
MVNNFQGVQVTRVQNGIDTFKGARSLWPQVSEGSRHVSISD